MKISRLLECDIYRDGGSYCASFELSDGGTYNLWLQRSRFPDSAGSHHKWLIEHNEVGRPSGGMFVGTGTAQERAILDALREVIHASDRSPHSAANEALVRLREMVRHIERREPCLPYECAYVHLNGSAEA